MTTLQTCGSIHALVIGPLLPSARHLQGFGLVPHPDGLLLDHGPLVRPGTSDEIHEADVVREPSHPHFGAEMVRSHRGWLAAMGVDSVGDFNEMCVRGEIARGDPGRRGFSREAHRSDRRCDRGPSGIQPVNLSLDDDYLDRDRMPRDESGELDFEALEALDYASLRDHLIGLVGGESVQTPRFHFKQGKSTTDGGPLLQIAPDQVLLIEGIHALNDALWPAEIPAAARMRIFVHSATTLPVDRLTATSSADLRLLRRIVRDRHIARHRPPTRLPVGRACGEANDGTSTRPT